MRLDRYDQEEKKGNLSYEGVSNEITPDNSLINSFRMMKNDQGAQASSAQVNRLTVVAKEAGNKIDMLA
mgnify:CR=1 FL=1